MIFNYFRLFHWVHRNQISIVKKSLRKFKKLKNLNIIVTAKMSALGYFIRTSSGKNVKGKIYFSNIKISPTANFFMKNGIFEGFES